jgi:hypothetical protein
LTPYLASRLASALPQEAAAPPPPPPDVAAPLVAADEVAADEVAADVVAAPLVAALVVADPELPLLSLPHAAATNPAPSNSATTRAVLRPCPIAGPPFMIERRLATHRVTIPHDHHAVKTLRGSWYPGVRRTSGRTEEV